MSIVEEASLKMADSETDENNSAHNHNDNVDDDENADDDCAPPPVPLTIEVEEDHEGEVTNLLLDCMGTDDSMASSLFSPTMSDASFTPNGSKSSRGKWTSDEDEVLRVSVLTHGGRNWKKISEFLEGRTDVQCLHRWQKVLRPGLVKGPWTKEEDDKVVELVGEFGVKSWSFIARKLEGRLGKQCRERWYNHLNPDINKEPWSAEEDRLIIEEHAVHGNKWAEIAKTLTGRTDNAIKNRWNSTLQRLLRAPPSTKKVKIPRTKKLSKKKEKEAAIAATKAQQQACTEDDDTDSICLSLDIDPLQTEDDSEDTESEGCTTTSSSCSESLSPSPALGLDLHQQDHSDLLNLTLISQMQNCTELWQQKHIKKEKLKQKQSATKCCVRPFSPASTSSSCFQDMHPDMLSPLDALLIAADSSFTCLKNATKATKTKTKTKTKSPSAGQVPYSPSILRRRQKSPQKTKQPRNQLSLRMTDATASHPSIADDHANTLSNLKFSTSHSFPAHDKLHQLAILSAAPLSGSISLKGEEFCMSPTDIRRSEVLLLSPSRYANQIGEESPTKRRKFSESSFLKKTENISVLNDEEEVLRAEEDMIAQSLLRMKTAHALVGDF